MSKSAWIFIVAVFSIGLFATYWYGGEIKGSMPRQDATTTEKAGIANPASVNCIKLGGTLEIAQDSNGGALGYCHLKDGRVCEEWSLMRGACLAPGEEPSTAP